MNRHQRARLRSLLCALLLAATLLQGCGSTAQGTQSTASASTGTRSAAQSLTAQGTGSEGASSAAAAVAGAQTASYAAEDLESGWEASSAVTVTLQGNSAAVEGEGAHFQNGTLTISKAGIYVLSGSLEGGQVVVNAGEKDTVRLILSGVNLQYADSAPLYCRQAGKVILTLADGTENTVTDGAAYVFADPAEDEPNAAVFSKNDLTINGSGTLNVQANYQHGILSKDNLVITDGTINVNAEADGIRGRDGLSVCGGTLTITAGSDGMQANNDKDADKGWIVVDGGFFTITAGNDGIQAETTLTCSGGTFELTCGGGSPDTIAQTQSLGGGMRGQSAAQAVTATEPASTKGLKAGTGIYITGGTYTVNSLDDAVHSNADVTISGGELTLSSGDDGVHADAALLLSGGTLQIEKCFEGLEGATVTMQGGAVHLTASDDGVNAAGGSDENESNPNRDSFRASSANDVRITGGYLVVNAAGDGLDSNGGLYVEGGTVLVNGPADSGNGALDYNGECRITGGVLIAAGGSGMAQAPGSDSTQGVLMVVYSTVQQAGTVASLCGPDGTALLSFAPAKSYQSIVFSAPELKQGETYTLFRGGSVLADEAGFAQNAALSGGTTLATLTLSAGVTAISEDGSAVTQRGMGGGGGGFGGDPSQRRGGMERGTPPDRAVPDAGAAPPEKPADGEQSAASGQSGATA